MLEVQIVNNIAPFLIVSQLLPLMRNNPSDFKFIVNVSSAEGRNGERNTNIWRSIYGNEDSASSSHKHGQSCFEYVDLYLCYVFIFREYIYEQVCNWC